MEKNAFEGSPDEKLISFDHNSIIWLDYYSSQICNPGTQFYA